MSEISRTLAREEALRVVAIGRSSISNRTDELTRTIYWQTAEWLLEHGYIQNAGRSKGRDLVEITAAGAELAGVWLQSHLFPIS